jgi:predicted N-acetyltransferase YhbS
MSGPVRIEQLAKRAELLPVVAAWIYNEWWQDIEGSSVSTVTDLLRAHWVPDRIPMTLVASLDMLPVGTATLLSHDIGTEQWPQLSPWLAAVYVVPEHRRRGVGSSLVNAIVSGAAAAGKDVLYLLTTEREAFYAQLGWEVFDRAGKGIVMSRNVANAGIDLLRPDPFNCKEVK